VTEPLPLNALLSRVLVALTREFEAAGAGTPPVPSLAVWSDVIRPVGAAGGDGIAIADLPAAARLSKRAVRAAVANTEKRGWLETVAGSKRVRLATAGEAAAERLQGLSRDIDVAWRARFGDDRIDALTTATAAVVRQLYLEWPHYPAGYGPADDSVTGGVYTAGGGLIDSKVPTHANDWAPVVREDIDGSSVAGLPLAALLSQALMSFASDFEELWIGSLHHAATVLRVLPDEGRPINEIPLLRGLPGNGKSVLERHLYIEIVRDPAAPKVKVAKPTIRGRNTRDQYEATVARVEARWRANYGDVVVSALRAVLEAIDADLDAELPHHVVGVLIHS
jgi:hypothetical protein